MRNNSLVFRNKISSICDTFLSKLISGQIRIKDAEKFVEGIL